MPRVAIEYLKLIEIDDLINLIGKDLEAIRCALTDSSYSKQILAMSQEGLDYSLIESALMQNYSETIQKLLQFSSGNIQKLLVALSKKIETANIKTILRAAKAHINVSDTLENIFPLGALNVNHCRAILETVESVEDVIAALSDFEYGKVLKQVVNQHGGKIDLTLLEVALDKAVFREILEIIEKFAGVDAKIAKALLEIELDTINFKIILKCKELAIKAEAIEEYLMPTGFFTEAMLEEAIEASNVKSIIECLSLIVESAPSVYKELFAKLLQESDGDVPLSRLEAILDKAPLEMSIRLLRKYRRYYNIGFLLAFLNLKWTEVKNLRCIVKGSERKIPHSQVRKLLTIPDDWKS